MNLLLRRTPGGLLAAHVATLWTAQRDSLPHRLEWMLPTGAADLVIPLHDDTLLRLPDGPAGALQKLRGGVLQGAHEHACLRATGGAVSVVGVHFRPGGAAAIFGGVAAEAANRCVALADLPLGWTWLRERLLAAPTPAARLRELEAGLTAALLERHADGRAGDALVLAALREFARAPTLARVAAVRRASGLGPTRFIERFRAQVGLTPKRYARVQRFNQLIDTLRSGREVDWAAVALDGGYSDQAHLVREFRALAGVTPLQYRSVAADRPRHVAHPAAGPQASNR